jgi:lysophospholipase L1-like esterase
MMTALALLLLQGSPDKTRANSHDDAWEAGWVAHCRTVYTSTGKSAGMVLHVGDSITHANPYGQWQRNGAGKTAEDVAILGWYGATASFPGGVDPTSTNGLYLAAVDVAGRSMTASGGLTTGEFLSGTNNGGPNMPGASDQATGRANVSNATYTNNLHVDSVVWAFSNAQFAVLMLGTNDVGGGVASGTFATNLASIVDKLEARGIVVVLSTIPPRNGSNVGPYNTAIRSLAQTRGLPLIDYYEEIVLRQPDPAWLGTLIDAGDGVHPTAGVNGATSTSDPYASGGSGATHTTGTNAAHSGYLLRSWLTAQKLKEVKSYVVDGVNPPGGGGGGGGGGAPPPAPSSSSSDDDDGKCGCGTASAASSLRLAFLLPLLLLGLRRR